MSAALNKPAPAMSPKLQRLWAELRERGIGHEGAPSPFMQHTPYKAGISTLERVWDYALEALFTGLYTDERETLFRAYVQAHGYFEASKELGHWPSSYYSDLLRELRCRAERVLLRGQPATFAEVLS